MSTSLREGWRGDLSAVGCQDAAEQAVRRGSHLLQAIPSGRLCCEAWSAQAAFAHTAVVELDVKAAVHVAASTAHSSLHACFASAAVGVARPPSDAVPLLMQLTAEVGALLDACAAETMLKSIYTEMAISGC